MIDPGRFLYSLGSAIKVFCREPRIVFVLFTKEYQEDLILGKQGSKFKLGNFPLRVAFAQWDGALSLGLFREYLDAGNDGFTFHGLKLD